MPPAQRPSKHRRIKFVFGLALAGILYIEFYDRDYAPVAPRHAAIVLAAPQVAVDPFEKLLREKPLAALIEARERHVGEVRDYRLTFIKQELLPSGRMSAEQEIEVKYRQEPYSVVMHWVRNGGMASRVIYVKGRWIDPKATNAAERELMMCQPGELGRRFIKSLKLPARGSLAKDSARRSIDEFGFMRTLDLLIKYCKIAESRDELTLEYRGETRFNGRPMWVIQRNLPYTGDSGPYPDRTAEIFIDQEYRVPVAVYCYSDEAKEASNLLGKYEFRNIHFNVGLTGADFDPATYGM